ncbi:phospho-N-acetylmuramoyl-pentapeptide-transferase [Ignavibacteria bacterium]|jgi:phospho-N-acetylmuramoyl-pentapeptide-transferase|nr:phospho-N-acetylmuramoyl-pentapeptide-transferase [Bacteroidota bacterium]MCZ2132055.1 phospho-N-acetylmuramoyl-pentapeptide-transferase [Bacteroidota bacterium]
MLYFLAQWLRSAFNTPGFGVFQYVTFRAAAAVITALLISFILGPRIIAALKRRQIGEQAKKELQSTGNHSLKAGTPTMGGLIVLASLLLPTLLWANIFNAYIILILAVTAILGCVGFLDDYLKVIKKLPKGLIGRYKIFGQVTAGLLIGCSVYFFPEWFSGSLEAVKTLTTVPFAKNINFDFGIFYIPAVILILTATSNAVNLTDGLDGLSIGTVGIAALTLAVIAYFGGNAVFASYLNIMHLRGSDELAVFCAALVGAAMGFLWFNSHPAQVFMGDTGSLALGGAIGGLCILIKKEFLLPIVGGVFFAETLSVIIQVLYFKYTKKRYGEGRRVFKMSPLHHHFEKSGWPESKIVVRFYIIAIMLAIITMATFKVR